jgi:hypothetical protein
VRRLEVDGDALRASDAGGTPRALRGERLGLDELEVAWPGDFIVQERLRQHATFAAVHPASVNTLRLVTFRWAGTTELLLSIARFGTGGRVTDNAATDGLLCRVGEDGRLDDHALDLDGRPIEKHPDTGHAFRERLVVPGWEAFRSEALRLHGRILHADLVSWDFAVGEDGAPIFLEMNFQGVCHAYQIVKGGPLFGAHTEAILEAIRDARPRGGFVPR